MPGGSTGTRVKTPASVESAMSQFLLALVLACSSAPTLEAAPAPVPPAAEAAAPAAVVGTPPSTPVDAACLEKADLADGKKDGTVHHCSNCGLLMEGDAAHASTHAGMTFHACSSTCKLSFEKEPDAVLARACGKS